ncbi:hypothetical protein NAL32_02765 [Chryseobacterium sp. Ch-15]|uniref:Strictosidine synthase n=1 Tax=Chryseobacterium muglaense TaxID=2893752 RepID=A0A9Q3UUZ0_9FLAO|nr:strictosidine synthase [Chryseobacterium muglaense]MBD3903288.1 strictosidine synthase [Chryseobacterium muglaense]MCC9036118.1 hypothetical protein [Chryseobacterium muglaense]MCM2553306.1 hypothetical protein [Chryseobacterium muglaense]
MKILLTALILGLFSTNSFAQNSTLKPIKVSTNIETQKWLSTSILLWVRTDKPRQAGMDRWKGPHSQIIAATAGLQEYRQIHLTENNPGLWQPIAGVETNIPADRKIDGIADVTMKNFFSLLRGKKQTKMAYADEINLFKRTILYAAMPKWSKWYKVAEPDTKIEGRSIVFFRKKEGVNDDDFKKFIADELAPTLANTGVLKELRSKEYMPWKESQWNTPNVFHDNATEVQFQASLMLGFTDKNAMEQFFKSNNLKKLSEKLAIYCSAIHAYEILETLTFVENGKKLAVAHK